MKSVNIYEAKTRFSQLVDAAAAGRDIVISRNGKPVARLTRLAGREKPCIKFGVLKGKIRIAPDFDAPLSPEILAGFEGR